LWFQLHRLFNGSALLLIIGGLISAILMVPVHPFTLPHHFIGIIAVAIALWQPINAALRPHPASAGQQKSRARAVWEQLHHWSGRIGLLLASINIFLGIAVIHAHPGFFGGFAAWLLLLLVAVGFLERRLRQSQQAATPEATATAAAASTTTTEEGKRRGAVEIQQLA
jgi:hypothetical protein